MTLADIWTYVALTGVSFVLAFSALIFGYNAYKDVQAKLHGRRVQRTLAKLHEQDAATTHEEKPKLRVVSGGK